MTKNYRTYVFLTLVSLSLVACGKKKEEALAKLSPAQKQALQAEQLAIDEDNVENPFPG